MSRAKQSDNNITEEPSDGAHELARRIFDYGLSVEWGEKREILSQHEMACIIEEWLKEQPTGAGRGDPSVTSDAPSSFNE